MSVREVSSLELQVRSYCNTQQTTKFPDRQVPWLSVISRDERIMIALTRIVVSLWLGLILLPRKVTCFYYSMVNTGSELPASILSGRFMQQQDDSDSILLSTANAVLPAQVALSKSAKFARSIRRDRTNRGRSDSDQKINITQQVDAASKPAQLTKNQSTPKVKEVKKKVQQIQQTASGIDFPYESTITALRAYHSIHQDLVIPRRYVVPSETDTDTVFPAEWHGVDLSSTVYNMNWWQRNVKEKPERVAELNTLGFVWGRMQPEWNMILEALITYSTMHGDVLVPNKFIVPHGERAWHKATWGIPLGNCVYRIRARNDFLRGSNADTRREQLDGLGFVWDVHEDRFRKFYTALRHFARLGDCGAYSSGRTKALRVPCSFVVPQSDDWPKELWGFQLGVKCTAVRQKDLYVKSKPDRKLALVDLGFRWSGNADLGWLEVVHAAAIYSRMNKRNLDVPYHFVVPSPPSLVGQSGIISGDDWPWPEHLCGLPLGQRLKDIRVRGAYLSGSDANDRRRQLDALGFNWTPKRGRPKINLD
jgi:hypothetical protein